MARQSAMRLAFVTLMVIASLQSAAACNNSLGFHNSCFIKCPDGELIQGPGLSFGRARSCQEVRNERELDRATRLSKVKEEVRQLDIEQRRHEIPGMDR